MILRASDTWYPLFHEADRDFDDGVARIAGLRLDGDVAAGDGLERAAAEAPEFVRLIRDDVVSVMRTA